MRKKPRTSGDKAVVDVWKREVGELSTRNFARRLRASEDLVLRLDIFRKLEKHRRCVNTVSFNVNGDILVSGSDDRNVILWDWETGNVKLSFHSGHISNVFQAKIMPHTDDHSIVTCAADGQVRHALIQDHGPVETKLLGKHRRGAHKLAIEPGSPNILYTCGEDGLVQHFDLRTGGATVLFTCKARRGKCSFRLVRLYAIAIDPRNPNLFAVAGSDEYTRLYDIRKYRRDALADFGEPIDHFCPHHLIGDNVGITGLAFSDESELLVSYNDEFIYLFTREMGWGPNLLALSDVDTDVSIVPQAYKGHRNRETVKGVNFFGPRCEYVVSGSDCGRIFIWRKKGGELIRVMEADKHVVNCIESHPHATVLASSGIERDIKIWTPSAIDRAALPLNIEKVVTPYRYHFFPIGDIGNDQDDNDDDSEYDDDDEDDDDDHDNSDDDEELDDEASVNDDDSDDENDYDFCNNNDDVSDESWHDQYDGCDNSSDGVGDDSCNDSFESND